MKNLIANLIAWLARPALGPLFKELSQRQAQIIQRLADFEDVLVELQKPKKKV